MMPILPPELTYTILESTILSAHDLTKIALSSRALLPVARKLLYRSIKVYYEADFGFMLYAPDRPLPRDPHRGRSSRDPRIATRKRYLALDILRLNPLLPSLVKKVHISQRMMMMCPTKSLDFVSEILRRSVNVEALILSDWKCHPKDLEEVIAKDKESRLEGSRSMLSIHIGMSPSYSRWTQHSINIALSSLNPQILDSRFVADFLASSTSSLQAIEIPLADAHLYQKYKNITTLFVRHDYGPQLEDVQRLLVLANSFSSLGTLSYRSARDGPSLDTLLWLVARLPSTLRSLSLECGLSTKGALKVSDALPSDTCLRHLNISRFLTNGAPAGKGSATEICRRKGVKLTIGEKWNLWDNICRSSFVSSRTLSILTCFDIE